MPVINRTRFRSHGLYTGTIKHLPSGTVSDESVGIGYDRCEDTIGDFGGLHGLAISHSYLTPGTVTGRALAFPTYEFIGYPVTNQVLAGSHLTDTSVPSTAEAITRGMADSNPSRPHVSVPNFLFELKDLPGMLLSKGRAHHRNRAGNSVAEYNFGWDSLFRDFTKLLDFNAAVDKRVDELKRVYSNGGLRRKTTIYKGSVISGPIPVDFHTFEAGVLGTYSIRTTYHSWTTCRWKPTTAPATPPSDANLRARARLLVHGWDFSATGIAASLWEALPWSWLTDWFSNVGDYLSANRNNIEFTPSDGCYMVHAETTHTGSISSVSDGFSASAPISRYVTSDRYLGSSSLSFVASQPFLAAKRLVTLSSIALGFK